jgi:hypothetical protein
MEKSKQEHRNEQKHPSRQRKIYGFREDISKRVVPGHDCLQKIHSKSSHSLQVGTGDAFAMGAIKYFSSADFVDHADEANDASQVPARPRLGARAERCLYNFDH